LKDFAGKDFGAPDALATQLATFCGPTPKIEQVMTCDVSAAYVPRQFYSDARADVGDDGRVRRIEVAVRLHPWARCTVTTPCDAIGAEAIAAKVVEVRAVLRHATALVYEGLATVKTGPSEDRAARVTVAANRILPILQQSTELLGALYRTSKHSLDDVGIHDAHAGWAEAMRDLLIAVGRDATFASARLAVRRLAFESEMISDIISAHDAVTLPPGATTCAFAAPIFLGLLAPSVGVANVNAIAAHIPLLAVQYEAPPLVSDVTLNASGDAVSCLLDIHLRSRPATQR